MANAISIQHHDLRGLVLGSHLTVLTTEVVDMNAKRPHSQLHGTFASMPKEMGNATGSPCLGTRGSHLQNILFVRQDIRVSIVMIFLHSLDEPNITYQRSRKNAGRTPESS